jgi:HAD superfamily phosphoserine phosphatase-like hydrolase
VNTKRIETISIFDFDRTLIKKDSFRLFSFIAAETFFQKIIVIILALICKFRLLSNKKYKELTLSFIWKNRDKSNREKILKRLYTKMKESENKKIMEHLEKHLRNRHTVLILSASPEFYLKPYIKIWSEKIEVFGAEVYIRNGRILIKNLHGQEKFLCAKTIIDNQRPDFVRVYTDHFSDLPIIKLADHVCLVNPSVKLKNKLAKLKINYEVII